MGKYTRRKSKSSREASLMEVPSLGGVLTRAKTLALQKQKAASNAAASYIQLRSRRLVKPNSSKKQKETYVPKNPNKLPPLYSSIMKVDSAVHVNDLAHDTPVSNDGEGSFGENTLEQIEFEGRGRTTRETTPCSLIRDPNAIKTPGSSTKSTRRTETKHEALNTTPKPIPSTSEMDEFFTGPEKQQQRLFIEKYNFDPVNDKPLRGRYEWVKVDASEKS